MKRLFVLFSFLFLALPAHAASNDIEFLFQLGMMEGHLMVGHDLLKAGKQNLAMPHFGHPVREIYGDLTDYMKERHIKPFDDKLIKLEAAAATAPDSPKTEALYQSTIAAIHDARQAVPEQVRNSIPEMIRVCANTVDAAAGEYSQAVKKGKVDTLIEYHDSRGYLSYVQQQVDQLSKTHTDAADQSLIAKFKAILAKAEYIVAPLMPGAKPRATVEEYRAIATKAGEVVKN